MAGSLFFCESSFAIRARAPRFPGGVAMNFTPLDWAIVGIYLLLSVTVGVLARKYVGGVADYLVAGRELGTYLGIATLAATEIGTITFMHNAECGYRYCFAACRPAL